MTAAVRPPVRNDSTDSTHSTERAQRPHPRASGRLRATLRSTVLDRAQARPAYWPQVLETTSNHAVSRPDSAALSRPNSVKVLGWQMGHCASMATRRDSRFQHLPLHPAPFETGRCGPSMLIPEPETMTTPQVGTSAAASAVLISERSPAPHHYLKRLAFRLADRAALRRAELRARAYGVIAADRLQRGAA